MDPLVRIRGLTVEAETRRGTARILHGIDLDIGRGRILGVVGESGSGKSTLASCLIGLQPSNLSKLAGEIVFDGVDILKLSTRDLAAYRGRRIAMIFQDPMTALNPLFTVATHVLDVERRVDPALSRKGALDRAETMLRKVGIPDAGLRLAAYPHQLSGGMRQRVMIAMALLVEPDLLLADEPTTALDATVEAQIVDLFDQLRAEFSGSVLFISHHLGLVAQLCDDIAVMYGGAMVETGAIADVVTAPRHPYTAALLACEIEEDADAGRLKSIPGDVPDPVAPLDACIFAPRCAHAVAACRTGVPPVRTLARGGTTQCLRDLGASIHADAST